MSAADAIWAAQAQLKPAALAYRLQGRSFWVARYRTRDDIFEWDLDWSYLPRRGLRELRLVCPNGQIAVLGGAPDESDRLFQLKIATTASGLQAHVIGHLDGTDGEATLWAWEPAYELPRDEHGVLRWEHVPGRLVGPLADNVAPGRCRYDSALAFPNYAVLGIKAD